MSTKKLEEMLARGTFFSGESLARAIGISRTAVFKQILTLRKLGYRIEAITGKGYRLMPRFDGMLPLEIRLKNCAKLFGSELSVLDTTDSTQARLRELAEKGAGEGTVVVALQQSSGKGRMGHSWHSPKGGLWFSLLLRPTIRFAEIYKFTLLFGVAVTRAIKRYGIVPSLKWPNDILVEGKKVCGILLETSAEPDRVEYVTVGIGVNANFSTSILPEDISANSTSLCDTLGRRIDRADLLAQILHESEVLYFAVAEEGFSSVIEEWRSLSCTIGREVSVSSFGFTVRGLALGIDDDGSLIIETEEGKKEKVYSGEVSFKQPE